MTPKEIKKTVDFLFSIVEFLMDDKISTETKIVDIKKANMMGRGTCVEDIFKSQLK